MENLNVIRPPAEHWSADPIDFAVWNLEYFGARRDDSGSWILPNGLQCSFFCCNPRSEPGWCRLQLAGFDGRTRSRLSDKTAPYLLRNPHGRWFWCAGTVMRELPDWRAVVDFAATNARRMRAVCGWPTREEAERLQVIFGGAA